MESITPGARLSEGWRGRWSWLFPESCCGNLGCGDSFSRGRNPQSQGEVGGGEGFGLVPVESEETLHDQLGMF